METKKIKGPNLGFDEFLCFVGIWLLITSDNRREAGCWRDAERIDGMNKEFIGVLTYLTEFVLVPQKNFVGESFWWRSKKLKDLILALTSSSVLLGSGC